MLLIITPTLQDDVSLLWLILAAVFNPATIATAFLMGRRADQAAKLIVAAFAAALAGLALVWLATFWRLPAMATLSRAAAGLFALQCAAGLGWAWLGYRFFPDQRPSR
jgi:hypothetical protein